VADRLSEIVPPDDSGTDALRRYRYQAHVIFAFCLASYFQDNVQAVTPEYFEDVLVECLDTLRFVQVKTRDPERGVWKLRHLAADGGALNSILRTDRALGDFNDGRRIVYDIRLEGAHDRADAIHQLTPAGGPVDASTVETCARLLGCGMDEANRVVGRVAIHPSQPPRELIEDRNLADLGRAAPHLSAAQLKATYDGVIELIDAAMRADLLSDAWPRCALEPDSYDEAVREKISAKRLDRARLAPVMTVLDSGERSVFSTITDPDRLRATDLERKMTTSGAPDGLIAQAKQMRAQAARHIAEFRGSSLLGVDALLADLEFRLLSVARIAAATSGGSCSAIWRDIESRLRTDGPNHDPRGILHREPLLLMGAICQYSDECKFPWLSDA
jgi:hypothetical protein